MEMFMQDSNDQQDHCSRVTPKSDDPRNLNGLTRKSCNTVNEQLSNLHFISIISVLLHVLFYHLILIFSLFVKFIFYQSFLFDKNKRALFSDNHLLVYYKSTQINTVWITYINMQTHSILIKSKTKSQELSNNRISFT